MNGKMLDRDELSRLLAAVKARQDAMTQEERDAEYKAQRESFARGMMPFGHDWTLEQCEAEATRLEKEIDNATGWGAALGAMCEDLEDLKEQIQRKKATMLQRE